MKCIIYRCSRKDEMYLYVPLDSHDADGMPVLPEELARLTGRLEKALELDVFPGRKLARADAQQVIASIEGKGFYIQMPPADVLLNDKGVLSDDSDTF